MALLLLNAPRLKENKMIKLYKIPRNSKIYIKCSDGSSYLIFNRVVGMYSYCTTEKSNTIHLSVNTPLEEYEDGYRIIIPHDTERSSVV